MSVYLFGPPRLLFQSPIEDNRSSYDHTGDDVKYAAVVDDDDLLAIRILVDNNSVKDTVTKRTLVYQPFNRTTDNIVRVYEELERMQNEHGWDVIILCSVVRDLYPCPKNYWIPANRIVPVESHIIDGRSFEAHLQNPNFDRIQWMKMMTTTGNDFQKSCFIKDQQRTVIHIAFHFKRFFANTFHVIQNAISMLDKASASNSKFHFHLLNRGFSEKFDTEFLNIYLHRYGVDHGAILFSEQEYENNFSGILEMMKTANDDNNNDSNGTTRNLYIIIGDEDYLKDVCQYKTLLTEHRVDKILNFYTFGHHTPLPYKCKGLNNFNDNIDIYRGDQFVNIVNELVCKIQ